MNEQLLQAAIDYLEGRVSSQPVPLREVVRALAAQAADGVDVRTIEPELFAAIFRETERCGRTGEHPTIVMLGGGLLSHAAWLDAPAEIRSTRHDIQLPSRVPHLRASDSGVHQRPPSRTGWWREPPGGAALLVGLLALGVAAAVGILQFWPSGSPPVLTARIDVVFVGDTLTPATIALDLSVFNPRHEPVQLASVMAVDTDRTPNRLHLNTPLRAVKLRSKQGFVSQRYTPVPQTIEPQEQKDVYLDAHQMYLTGASSIGISTASGFSELLPLGPLLAVLRCAVTAPPGRCVSVGAILPASGVPYVLHVRGEMPIGIETTAFNSPTACKQLHLSSPCLINVHLVYDPSNGAMCKQVRKADPSAHCDPRNVQIFNGLAAVDRNVHVYTSPELPTTTHR